MTERRSPEEIEQAIEHERAGLAYTLDDLQNRMSLDGVVRQVGDHLRENGGDIGTSISRSVKENPIALALTGIGLGWMIFGNRSDDDRRPGPAQAGRYRDSQMHDRADLDGSYHDSRPGLTRGIAGSGTRPSWAQNSGNSSVGRRDSRPTQGNHSDGGVADKLSTAAQSASETASGMRDSASQRASKATSVASDKLRGAGASVTASAAAARDKANDAGQRTAERTADLRERLSEGTETLGAEARERVISARARAMEASDAAARYTRQGRDRAADMLNEQPLIAGALAIAIGAAVGAALPRTRTEDQYFGEQSDELFEEAERIFAEERAKAEQVARAALDEGKTVATEVRDSAKHKAADAKAKADSKASTDTAAHDMAEKTKSAGRRVVGAAANEADRQDLGNPRT